MKKMLFALALLAGVATAASAQQTEAFPSFIEVTGVAEKEVIPNEIYLFDMHKYLRNIKKGNEDFTQTYNMFANKYSVN